MNSTPAHSSAPVSLSGSNADSPSERRFRATNYLSVAQIFLQSNFLLSRPLSFEDIKPRLLGHWGTCPGINFIYAGLVSFYRSRSALTSPSSPDLSSELSSAPKLPATPGSFRFILGPGHGFPALQANLFLDGILEKTDPSLSRTDQGIATLCKNFSFPGGFPSHASPLTPGVITEGGELGYALATAYGASLGHPSTPVFALLGDGEFETATTLASLNLPALLGSQTNVIPVLHLNGYKISGPTVFSRRSPESQEALLKGFGFTPYRLHGFSFPDFKKILEKISTRPASESPFIIFESEKGATGPAELNGEKIAGNYASHQVPLPLAKSDPAQLALLETWLRSYRFSELFDNKEGFRI